MFLHPTLNLKIIGNGPPLILLHGWGWHSLVWQPLVPLLSQHYQLFMIDLPGFGESPLLIDHYDFDSITSVIFDLVPEKATWLGWSLGGMVAWWVAIHHPEKINSLVTLAASPRFTQDENWPGIAVPTLNKFADSLLQHYEQTLTDFLELQLRGSKQDPALFEELKTLMFSVKKPDLAALKGGLALLRDTDFREDLSKIKCPSLHIFGSHDTLVPVRIISQIQPHLTHGKCEIIHRSGHMPFLSSGFAELLISHL
ncbi:MAG: pimeloyl-ACP methyl ester esterase BioH [Gammaproteobacteria bacterium]|nr:pimeloyl-ACP methyl ester esterase BioH [Gammaproteobacteria bacterium]